MGDENLSFYSFVLLSIFFFSSSPTNMVRAHEFEDITELCNRTDHLALCNAVVQHKAGDAVEATIMAIEATILQTKMAMEKAEKHMTMGSSLQRMGKMNLETCKEVYDDAITNLMTSMENAKAKALPELKINLSAVISDFSTCADGFLESPDVVFPLAHVNEVLSKLASTTLALACEVKA